MKKFLNNKPLLLGIVLTISFFVLGVLTLDLPSGPSDKVYLDEPVEGSYFSALNEELTVATTIDGDLNAVLIEDLHVNGSVRNVNAFLVDSVSITEPVDDVHVIAAKLDISSRVNGNVYFLGSKLSIPEGAVVTGSIYTLADKVNIEGTLLGELVPLVDEKNIEVEDDVTVNIPLFEKDNLALDAGEAHHKDKDISTIILMLMAFVMYGLLLWFIARGKKVMKDIHYGKDFLFGLLTLILFVPFTLLVAFFLGVEAVVAVVVALLGLATVAEAIMYIAISSCLIERNVVKGWSYQYYVLIPIIAYILILIPIIGVITVILFVIIFLMVVGNLVKRIFR